MICIYLETISEELKAFVASYPIGEEIQIYYDRLEIYSAVSVFGGEAYLHDKAKGNVWINNKLSHLFANDSDAWNYYVLLCQKFDKKIILPYSKEIEYYI